MPPTASPQHIVRILRSCRRKKDAALVLCVQALVCKFGLQAHTSLGNYLVVLLGEMGYMRDAECIREHLLHCDQETWNALITGYVKAGTPELALLSYEEMQIRGCTCASGHAFLALLKACVVLTNIRQGFELHSEINRLGILERDPYIGSALVDMYAKFGLLSKAQQVFDELILQDTVSWNALMTAHMNHGHCEQVLDLFEIMRSKGIFRDAVTFLCSLKACSTIGDADKAEEIYEEIRCKGLFTNNNHIGSTLIDMFAKFGALTKARLVFDGLASRNLVVWNSLIAAYAEHNHSEEALHCLKQMKLEGFTPNATTLVSILKACSSTGAIGECQAIHADIARMGFLEENVFVGTSLVDMYAKHGCLAKAQEVFDKLLVRNAASWTALIAGYADQGHGEKALKCYERMQHDGIPPDVTTLVCCLKACGCAHAADKGREIHVEIERLGWFGTDLMLANTLVDMYIKCGFLAQAQEVFDHLPTRNVATWTSLIEGYAENGSGEEAMKNFVSMLKDGVPPNAVSLMSSLKACASMGALLHGQGVHQEIARKGLDTDLILGNTLVDMYAKCGTVSKAREVFDKLPERDVVSWNALISGYTEHERAEEALKCLKEMRFQGIAPDAATFACSLKACASIGAEDEGQELHAEIARKGFLDTSIVVGSTLVEMYAKCGMLVIAERVFEKLPVQDLVSWNSLMAGYAQLGDTDSVFLVFDRMRRDCMSPPDMVTFLIVLNACSSTGLSLTGRTYFEAMSTEFGVVPALEHHSCMVDLLSREGSFDKALAVMMKMPFCPNLVVWNTMLSACKSWGNKNLGRQAFQNALCLDQKDSAAYVLVSHILADNQL